jgi:cytochrome c oxidase assembly protein subunit 15
MIALWLFACAFLVFLMVAVGGVTRLTESGLSIVEWKPVSGALPPLSESAWQKEFGAYQTSPEYLKKNSGMGLQEFKGIFWLEYLHRLLGRLVGIVFMLPYLFFLFKGAFTRRQAWGYAGILLLGGLQGVVGWYMVKSGLVDNPRVSPYRLMAHLGMALLLFALLFIQAHRVRKPEWLRNPVFGETGPAERRYFRFSLLITGLMVLQILLGALVAGNHAGLVYNTFPTMDGQIVPDGLMARQPATVNFFENPTLVQFDHRIGAYLLTFFIVFFWWKLRRVVKISFATRLASNLLIYFVFVQFLLGVFTLLYHVPVTLASLHQINAIMLLAVSLFINQHLYAKVRAAKD